MDISGQITVMGGNEVVGGKGELEIGMVVVNIMYKM